MAGTHNRLPFFNEKVVCALGDWTERPAQSRGGPEAVDVLGRFVRLARAMAVDVLDILATAAVRDALDGPDFVAAVERRCGVPVSVLSGEEEARLAAMGVLCSAPQADGTVADLGGGSLELVALDQGRFAGPYATMPLGVLRLSEASGNVRALAEEVIEKSVSVHRVVGMGQRIVRFCGRRGLARPGQALSGPDRPSSACSR